MKMKDILGHTCQDSITGFQGICMGVAIYYTGCNQVLLQQTFRAADPKNQWFDVARVVVHSEDEVIKLPGTELNDNSDGGSLLYPEPPIR